MTISASEVLHFVGLVQDGKVQLYDKAAYRAGLEPFDGHEIEGELRRRGSNRSAQANAYYWGVVVQAAHEESGQAPNDIHSYWCELFLPDEKKRLEFFNRLTGERLQVTVDTRRTSRLTGHAFYDFVENCRLWCQEYLNVTTPDPDPDFWRKRDRKESAA